MSDRKDKYRASEEKEVPEQLSEFVMHSAPPHPIPEAPERIIEPRSPEDHQKFNCCVTCTKFKECTHTCPDNSCATICGAELCPEFVHE
jgi:hypothetical protein